MENNEFRNPNLIVKNSVYLFARYVLVMFLAFYTTRLTLQVLGDEDYGINNVIGGLISMFAIISMPITSALQRYFNVEFARKEISAISIFNTSLRITGLIIILMMFLYETVGLYLVKEVIQYPLDREKAVVIIFHLTAVMTVFSFATVPYTAFLFAKEDMGVPAVVELFGSLYKLLFLWLIPLIPSDSLVLYTVFLLTLYLLQFLFFVFYCRNKYCETRFAKRSDNSLGRSIIKFAGWNSIEAVAGISITYLSNIIINVFGGVLYNTAYGLAKSLSSSVSSLTINLIKAVEPQITSSTVVKDDYYRNSLVLTTIKLSMICVGYVVVFFVFSGSCFLTLWLGSVPLYAYDFCLVMLLSSLFSSIILPLRSMIIATGRIQWYFSFYGIISLLILVLMYILLLFGMPIITAAILIVLCSVFYLVLAVFTSVKVTTLSSKDVIKTMISAAIVVFISFVVYGSINYFLDLVVVYKTILSLLASSIALVISTYFIALNRDEKILAADLFKIIKNIK